MVQYTSSVTTKGQVTIPVEIRRLLDISPHDKVAFIVEDEQQVRIAPAISVVARTAGMLKSDLPRLSLAEEKAAAEEAIAEDVMERMQRSR